MARAATTEVRPVWADLVGEALSVADFAVAITLPYAQQARLPLEGFPEIRRWHARLNELEAWREPFPTLQAA